MKIHIAGLHVLDDAALEKIKAAAAAAGHELVDAAKSETDKLVLAIKAEYPDVVTGIEKLIADAKSKDAKGIDKLEAVALDSVALLPEVVKAPPSVKDFAIKLAQSVYTDGIEALETAAGKVLAAL